MKARLDRCFSWWVRLRETNSKGMVNCYTCNKQEHWTKVDAGHFMSRVYISTRWVPTNVKPQCKACNIRSGEQYLYSLRLDQMYGPGTANRLYEQSRNKDTYTIEELETHVEYYETAVATILARRIKADRSFNRRVPQELTRRIRVDRSRRRDTR